MILPEALVAALLHVQSFGGLHQFLEGTVCLHYLVVVLRLRKDIRTSTGVLGLVLRHRMGLSFASEIVYNGLLFRLLLTENQDSFVAESAFQLRLNQFVFQL